MEGWHREELAEDADDRNKIIGTDVEDETGKAAEQVDLQKKKTPEGAAAQELLDEVLSEVFS